MHKSYIDTPALLLDAAVLERNQRKMSEFIKGTPVHVRPHVKLHRATPELARMQLQAGATGLTCAKLSEAEILAEAGVKDILIANQIVGPRKIERLLRLAETTDVAVAIDDRANAEALSRAANRQQAELRVLIEVNIGHNRSGVAPYGPTLDLAKAVVEMPALKFMGLMGYDGHCTLKVKESEREGLSLAANTLLAETGRHVEAHGIAVPIVSAGGTFTYRFASRVEGITEIQPGTYLLMDTAFRENGVQEFECALSVLTTIISRPTYPGAGRLAIVDAGRKSISPLLGLPEVKDPGDASVFSLSDEHGRITLGSASAALSVEDKIELWVRDANGTINQFDRFHVVRDDIVEAVWRIPLCGQNT
jgi:D-serine deaminase-like pyridoxal phosphate-dependent protein